MARIDHAYSHFKITLHAFRCRLIRGTPEGREGQPLQWVAVSSLDAYAYPRANRRLIETLQAQLRNPTLFCRRHVRRRRECNADGPRRNRPRRLVDGSKA